MPANEPPSDSDRRRIAAVLRSEAAIANRPGQMARLERLADEIEGRRDE